MINTFSNTLFTIAFVAIAVVWQVETFLSSNPPLLIQQEEPSVSEKGDFAGRTYESIFDGPRYCIDTMGECLDGKTLKGATELPNSSSVSKGQKSAPLTEETVLSDLQTTDSKWQFIQGAGTFEESSVGEEGIWLPECTLSGPKFFLDYFKAGALLHKRELRIPVERVDFESDIQVHIDGELAETFRKVGVAEAGMFGIAKYDSQFVQLLISGKKILLRDGAFERPVSLSGSAKAAKLFAHCASTDNES